MRCRSFVSCARRRSTTTTSTISSLSTPLGSGYQQQRTGAAQPRSNAWLDLQPHVSEFLQVNESLPQFKQLYEEILKKRNWAENSEKGRKMKEIAKWKYAALEETKAFNPGKLNEMVKMFDELEVAIENYRPSVIATVEEAFDTKNHPFITDSVNAEIYQRASELFDRRDWARKLLHEKAGLTPRKMAEQIYQGALKAVARVGESGLPKPDSQPPTRGDLPAWAVGSLGYFAKGSSINSKAQLLDALFPKTAPQVETNAAKTFRTQGKEAAVKVQMNEIIEQEHLVPGTPAYAQFEEDAKDFDPTPSPEVAEFQQTLNARVAVNQAERQKAEALLAKHGEAEAQAEALEQKVRYTGEHATARRAINGFLLANPSPSDQDKLQFMKTLQEAIRASRQTKGVVLRELYPFLNLPTERKVPDQVLLQKFDSYAATL